MGTAFIGLTSTRILAWTGCSTACQPVALELPRVAQRRLPRNFLPKLRNGWLEDLAGLAVDEFETECGGAVTQSA